MDLKTSMSLFFMRGPGHEERYSALAYALVSPHRYLSVPPGIDRGCLVAMVPPTGLLMLVIPTPPAMLCGRQYSSSTHLRVPRYEHGISARNAACHRSSAFTARQNMRIDVLRRPRLDSLLHVPDESRASESCLSRPGGSSAKAGQVCCHQLRTLAVLSWRKRSAACRDWQVAPPSSVDERREER